MARSGRAEEFQPAQIEDAQRSEFEELGVSIPASETNGKEDAFEIWDINRPSFEAFVDCETQWRFAAGFGFCVRLGLDWSAVDILLRRRGLGDDQFEDLRMMEAEALEAYSEADQR